MGVKKSLDGLLDRGTRQLRRELDVAHRNHCRGRGGSVVTKGWPVASQCSAEWEFAVVRGIRDPLCSKPARRNGA